MASEAGRELGYLHWPHEELAKAMVQAERDIEALKAHVNEIAEERDQYWAESRRSAAQLGRIFVILRDDEIDPHENPARGGSGRPVRRRMLPVEPKQLHQYVGSNGIFDLCACGTQWLVQADRCVTQPVKP